MPLHDKRFPGESEKYRAGRDALLKAEIELRRNVERVAAQRRELPKGGAVPEDYTFEEGGTDISDEKTVRTVKMSKLFEKGKPSLIIYSFMYGPNMKEPCPSCSSIIDSLNGVAVHVAQRANLVVIAKSPIARIRTFARERGWDKLRLLSSANNSYHRDYFGEDEKGSQWPILNVFTKDGGKIFHTFATELLFAPKDPGQDFRHADMIWPLWNLLDYTPEGRGSDWRPRLRYK